MRSYILIIHRILCAIIFDPRDLSLWLSARLFGGAHRPGDGKIKSFRISRLAVSVHGDLYVPPIRRADSPREINEAERPGRMRGLRSQRSPEILIHFSLFGCLRSGSVERVVPGRRSKIFQNL